MAHIEEKNEQLIDQRNVTGLRLECLVDQWSLET